MTAPVPSDVEADFEARRDAHVQQAAGTAAAALRGFAQEVTTEDLAAIGREGIDLTPLRGTITMPDEDLPEAYAYTVWRCPECETVNETDDDPDGQTETCSCGQEVRVR